MRNLALAGGVALTLLGMTSADAKVLDFKFSFSDNGSQGFIFETPGTVTGEIIGLIDNATSAATAVFIDSAPAALGFSLATPYDTTQNGYVVSNSFTVSNGRIVADSYDVNGAVALIFALGGSVNYVEGPTGRTTGNFDGLAGVTFTAVPENSTWVLALVGFAGVGLVSCRRARQREGLPAGV